ncbi:MAG: hypothetical protein HQM06_05355 [Magnetococcales bacterium]|nr:hypothetical protein [Magnetococcales bacterium]
MEKRVLRQATELPALFMHEITTTFPQRPATKKRIDNLIVRAGYPLFHRLQRLQIFIFYNKTETATKTATGTTPDHRRSFHQQELTHAN